MITELKVPFRRESEIEHAAHELLQRYAKWKGKPVRAPIDVENILEGFLELDIAYIDLPDYLGVPDVLGATFIKDHRIFIDESLMVDGKEGRLAFTLAHESGHWQLHRPLIEAAEVTAPLFSKDDLPEQPTILCRSSQKKAPVEWQADRFAACLLMPAADVRATVRALYGDKLPTWEDVEAKRKARELDEKLRDLATEVMARGSFTNVSNEAMRYRLLDLKLVADASNPQRSLL
jgi:Zn-dependent peptidase ImmA (M78 family)